ncbi:MAG: hypothetical protein ACOCZU_07870 [Planctomycetota bacterium]
MCADFNTVADDFFVNMTLQTTLALPTNRETVLHFFEAVQREFPAMGSFYQREPGGEFVLEGDRESGSYPWMELHENRLSAGFFNPPDAATAYRMHHWLLDRSVYFLGCSPLDVDSLDVVFGFNLDYQGNRDRIVSQALLGGSPLGAFLLDDSAQPLECEPGVVIALDEDCYVQARLAVETRSNSYQVRTSSYSEDPISVYFTVRQYPAPGKVLSFVEAIGDQCSQCEELVCAMVIPNILRPIASAIAGAR